MAAQYANDWEDPRLSVEGFVVDYVVWRLAVDGFEWREAPAVQECSEKDFAEMRAVCAAIEQADPRALPDRSFWIYRAVVDSYAASVTRLRSEISYEQVLNIISTAGAMCMVKARKGKGRDMQRIVEYTAELIDGRIRASWAITGQSWAGCWAAVGQLVTPDGRSRPSSMLARSDLRPFIPAPTSLQPLLWAAALIAAPFLLSRLLDRLLEEPAPPPPPPSLRIFPFRIFHPIFET